MICRRWLSVWRCCSWVWAVCVMWTAAAADDQVPLTPLLPPGDWPDSSVSQDSPPSPSPTQHNGVGVGAGTHDTVKETASAPRTVQAATVPASTAATTITVSAAHVNPSFTPTEEVLKAQRTSASSSPMASSTPVATPTPAAPTPRPSSTEKPIQPTYTSPAAPPQQPTLLPPSYSPRSLVDVTEAGKVEDGVKVETEPEKESPCDFDTCVHLQQPCPEVKEAMGWSCRCPGLTADPFATPAPVTALQVTRAWPRAAGVQWCAPYSALSAFLVRLLRQDGSTVSNGTVSSSARRTTVFGLEAGHAYSVCVSALSVNGARASHKRCVAVATPQDAEAIGLYVLTGGCAALLLTAAVLSACLYRQCRRGHASGANTLNNPTAQTLHDPRLTSLVSISNPAYAHSDEQTSAGNAHYSYRAQPKKSASASKKG